jgi:hypothetical protein
VTQASERVGAGSTKRIGIALVLGVLCLAPTAGDIGGCGTEVTALDPVAFAAARKDEDCARCRECGLGAPRCQRACDPVRPPETSLPTTCRPIAHDGDVCLRALRAASCEAYATYVDEVAPAIPSECEFCKLAPPAGTLPGFSLDAAVEGAAR